MTRIVLSLSLVSFLASSSLAGDWHGWRGPHGDGTSEEKGVPLTWSATENVKWKVPLDGLGNSTPIVVGERVFIAHAPAKSKLRTLQCFNRNNGELLWKKEVEYADPEATHGTNPYCSSSPVSDGAMVVVYHGSPGLFAYDMEGKELWKADLGKVEHIWGFGSSPVIQDGLVITNAGPGLNAAVIAVKATDGKEVWRKEYGAMKSPKIEDYRGSWSTPVLYKEGDQVLMLLSLPEKLYAVNPRTGEEVWSCGGLSKLVYTSPLVGKDAVVAMCGYTGPAMGVRRGGKGDVTETHRLWLTDKPNPQRIGSGIIVGDYLYILNETGIAWCLDPKTGEKKWEKRLGGPLSWSSMCQADGRLYVTNFNGDTYVLEADPDDCKVLAENKIGEQTRGSLAFSNGQVFLRTHKNLYCFEAKK